MRKILLLCVSMLFAASSYAASTTGKLGVFNLQTVLQKDTHLHLQLKDLPKPFAPASKQINSASRSLKTDVADYRKLSIADSVKIRKLGGSINNNRNKLRTEQVKFQQKF